MADLRPERTGFRPERINFRPEKADSRPERTGFRPERAIFRPERTDSRPERADFRPEREDFRLERADSRPWGDRRTNESPPVFYRTSSPSGPLPCFPSLQFTIRQSRATGIADHILPLGDLFLPQEVDEMLAEGLQGLM